ncbi:MAG: aspartate kinase [Candidatus Coatesbacteria bacterium]|nr:aspartate kinase [Candidatus Coatesbacteria bacterium]
MSVLVQKYGGKCVASPALIKQVAKKVIEARRDGHSVLVVMSAMGRKTDELIALAHEVSNRPSPRELDMLITVGERISISLLSMAISDLGFDSISFTGSQSGIITTSHHNSARIVDVRPERIIKSLNEGKIVIVAGFQGVSVQKEITTLGRGGSDLTAVVLAHALHAESCQLRKNVPGVMTADPSVIHGARLLDTMSPDKLLELACAGASVIHRRAARFVRRKGVSVLICSGTTDGCGTKVGSEQRMNESGDVSHSDGGLEAPNLDAVASVSPVCSVKVSVDENAKDLVPSLFEALSDRGVMLDMISQVASGAVERVSFVVADGDLPEVKQSLARLEATRRPECDVIGGLAKIGVVGDGFLSDPATLGSIRRALAKVGIAPLEMAVSALRVTFLVAASEEKPAVQAIHNLIQMTAS